MAKDPNENRDEDFDIEDDDAAEGEDESSSEAEEEAEEGDDDAASEEGADEGEEEDEEEGEDDDADEGEDDDEDYDPKLDPSGKFKGKSKKEIMQSYRNLETSIGEKAQKLAQDLLKKNGIKTKVKTEDAEGADGEEIDFDLGLTDEQIANMKPGEFGKVLSRKILEEATKIARNTIDRTNEVRGNVSREIKEATAAHPHLKENAEYRDIVISLIEAAAGRNEVLSLKDACKKADKAMGIVAKKKEETGADGKPVVKKKNRMSVERPGGSEGGKPQSDADRVRAGLMAGSSSTGSLGGLGV